MMLTSCQHFIEMTISRSSFFEILMTSASCLPCTISTVSFSQNVVIPTSSRTFKHITMFRYSSRLLSSVGSTSTLAPLPIAYHIVKRPLPYTVGLQLQNDIIDARLEAKGRNPESSVARQDVMLLLGE